MTVNVDHGGPSSSLVMHGVTGVNVDFITMDDFVQDMADGGGDSDNEDLDELALVGPEDAELFVQLINRLDNDDLLFGSPRWLENFKETKQATKDPLYKDCMKQWTTQCFDLQIQMLKGSFWLVQH